MAIVYWSLSQLLSYGVTTWLTFVGITFLVPRRFGLWGLVLGQVLVAVVIVVLDIKWILTEIRRPGWDGLPDMDIVFQIGVGLRIVLINSVLLPIGILAVLGKRRRGRLTSECI